MEKTAAAASARVGRDRTARAFARGDPLAEAARLFNRWTTLMDSAESESLRDSVGTVIQEAFRKAVVFHAGR